MSRVSLSAAQLDRIEDALEDLELHGVPEDLRGLADDDSVAIASHLDAYREILTMARETMPLQAPRAGLLDSVIAQAHADAGAASSNVAAGPPEPNATPWWQKLRASLWVPAVGFAGAAALLLVVIAPKGEREAVAEAVATPTASDKAGAPAAKPEAAPDPRLADASPARGEANAELQRGAGLLPEVSVPAEEQPTDEEELDESPTIAPEPDADPAAADARHDRLGSTKAAGRSKADDDAKPAPPSKLAEPVTPSPKPGSSSSEVQEEKQQKKKSAKPTGGSGGASPKTPAQAPPKDAPKAPPRKADPIPDDGDGGADTTASELAKAVSRGESRRASGQCGLARLDFDKARDAADANTRARALAGLGLCELAAGADAAARELLEAAKAADRSIAGFIEKERAKIEAARSSKQSAD